MAELLGGARTNASTYYNTAGSTLEELIENGYAEIDAGFTTLKDHLAFDFTTNISAVQAFRKEFGPTVG